MTLGSGQLGVALGLMMVAEGLVLALAPSRIEDVLGDHGHANVHGETQQKLDVIANDILVTCLGNRPSVAVVASEVRNLAQRSATAAKEIKALIDGSVQRVDQGAQLVDQAGGTMQDIVRSIERVTEIISAISHASSEQSTGIQQINQAVTQMDSVTQASAAQTAELAGTAGELTEQTQAVMAQVDRFRI